MKGTWQTDGGGGGGAGSSIDAIVAGAAVAGAVILVINLLMWVFHWLVDIAAITGTVTLTGLALYGRYKWKQLHQQRYPVQPPPQYQAMPYPPAYGYLPPPAAPPQALPAPQPQHQPGTITVTMSQEQADRFFGTRG